MNFRMLYTAATVVARKQQFSSSSARCTTQKQWKSIFEAPHQLYFLTILVVTRNLVAVEFLSQQLFYKLHSLKKLVKHVPNLWQSPQGKSLLISVAIVCYFCKEKKKSIIQNVSAFSNLQTKNLKAHILLVKIDFPLRK